MEETTIDKIRTRPRFKIYCKVSPEEVKLALKNYLKTHGDIYAGIINKEVGTISVKTESDPFWKPALSLRTETEDQRTVLRGIFGPNSAIWTLFMFLYFIFGILWMVFSTLWFVEIQIKSHDFPWALHASILMIALILLVYIAARFGQSKAKNEMAQLREFAIGSTEAIADDE